MRMQDVAFDGKPLPKYVTMFRDSETGELEFVFWRFPFSLILGVLVVGLGGFFTWGVGFLRFMKAGKVGFDVIGMLCPILIMSVVMTIAILASIFLRKRLFVRRGGGAALREND